MSNGGQNNPDQDIPPETAQPPVSDDSLFKEFVETGSREAFAEIERRFGDYLRKLAAKLLPHSDGSEDAAQEALLVVWRKRRELKPENLRAYLSQTLRYSVTENQRNRDAFDSIDGKAESAARLRDSSGLEEEAKKLERMWRAVSKLRPQDQKLLRARYQEGLEFEKLTMRYDGVSDPVLRQRLSRAVKRLRDQYKKMFPEDFEPPF